MRSSRHVITALAVLASATIAGVAVQQSVSADVSSGDRPVLVQINPCRLADTRPAPNNVGPRVGQLGATETHTFDVQESTSPCAGKIPTDALGISTNITALGATELSFLTIWGSGARPLAASLNPAPGEPPTPNAVVTGIAAGKFSVYNNVGSTHVVIDINGYYVNHTHDDRYPLTGNTGASTASTVSVGAAAFTPQRSNILYEKAIGNGKGEGGAWITAAGTTTLAVQSSLVAEVQLPQGSTVTKVVAHFSDNAPTTALNFQLRYECFNDFTSFVANGDSAATPAAGSVELEISPKAATVDNDKCSYFVVAESGSWASVGDTLRIRGFVITTI